MIASCGLCSSNEKSSSVFYSYRLSSSAHSSSSRRTRARTMRVAPMLRCGVASTSSSTRASSVAASPTPRRDDARNTTISRARRQRGISDSRASSRARAVDDRGASSRARAVETTSASTASVDLATSALKRGDAHEPGASRRGRDERARDREDDGIRHHEPALVCFTGGTAFNGIVDELLDLTSRVTHVLPVSDDGGSTAEIVRVLGGPAVGDLRSRCLRLSDESTGEARAVKELLAHRLHATDSAAAKAEWYRIQEGDHPLWGEISEPYADIIRSFLLYFHSQVTAAKVGSDGAFDFVNGSVGNFFFAGARMFFRSMEAAILLYSRVSRIPDESLVVPNILLPDNVRVALGAELVDGSTIRGQNEISHPAPDAKFFKKDAPSSAARALATSSEFWKGVIKSGALPDFTASEFWGGLQVSKDGHERVRDAIADGNYWSAGELLKSRLYDLTVRPLSVWDMDKAIAQEKYDDLDSPISRVFYLSTEDPTSVAAVYPNVNPTIVRQLERCDGIVYGLGSLYTSIVPSLILQGVGEAVAARKGPKVLILNGGPDRETGNMPASGVVTAVVDALNRAKDPDVSRRRSPAGATSEYVDVVIAPRGGGIPLDVDELYAMGVKRVVEVDAVKKNERGAEYDVQALIDELRRCFPREEDDDGDLAEFALVIN